MVHAKQYTDESATEEEGEQPTAGRGGRHENGEGYSGEPYDRPLSTQKSKQSK